MLEVYSEPCQTSTIELFTKIINNCFLGIFAKIFDRALNTPLIAIFEHAFDCCTYFFNFLDVLFISLLCTKDWIC